MRRETTQLAVVWAAVVLLSAATIAGIARRGGPLFHRPATFVDHVSPAAQSIRKVILLLPRVEPHIPRGELVTVFQPRQGQAHYDTFNFLAAVGLLPHHFVLPPFVASPDTARHDLVEWVVAIGEPFEHPHYRVVAGFPEGWLYRVER